MVIWRRSRYSVSFGETGRQDCRDGPESASTRTRGKGRPVNLLPKTPTAKGAAEMFSGDVWIDVIARGEEPSRIRANFVRFNPGARTAWHSHAVGQTLYVTEGVGWVQSMGSDVVEVRAGDVIYTPPGEWHWHGAAPTYFMTHIALSEAPAPGPSVVETEWGSHLDDGDYLTIAAVPRS